MTTPWQDLWLLCSGGEMQQVHPDANTSRKGNTLLPPCSCLGQGWDSPWLILSWGNGNQRTDTTFPENSLDFFDFFPWISREIWALLQRVDSTSLCWKELLVLPFGEGQTKSHTFIPFSCPNPLKELPLFPVEDPISSLALLLCPNPTIKA